MRSALACVLGLGLGLGAACFSETPSAGGAEGTTGEPCTPGALGCPCDDGVCAQGLACEPSVTLCIDPDCTPGAELCTCADGRACLQGLVCSNDGLCRVPSSSPGTGTSGGGVGSATMSTSATDDSTIPTGEVDGTGVSATTEPATSSGATGDGDPTGASSCEALQCSACYACESDDGGDCAMAWDACKSADGCTDLAGCAFACPSGDTACVYDCCTMFTPTGGFGPFNAVGACLEMACSSNGCMLELSCG